MIFLWRKHYGILSLSRTGRLNFPVRLFASPPFVVLASGSMLLPPSFFGLDLRLLVARLSDDTHVGFTYPELDFTVLELKVIQETITPLSNYAGPCESTVLGADSERRSGAAQQFSMQKSI